MVLIISIIIAIYVLLIAWVWNNLGAIDKKKKILIILIGTVIVYLITLIIFNISKSGINYENKLMAKDVRRILVTMFTGLNSLLILPFTAKIIERIYENQIEQKEVSKKLSIILIIFIICMFFECGYMKDIQKGILDMANVYSVQSNQ